jgi:hypothetical protein
MPKPMSTAIIKNKKAALLASGVRPIKCLSISRSNI